MSFPFHALLVELSKTRTLLRTKQLHALLFRFHQFDDPYFATKFVCCYSIHGDLIYARKLFDRIPQRTVYLWNSMIRAYAQAHVFGDAYAIFMEMLTSENKPDKFTFACIIRACSERFDINGLRVVHGKMMAIDLGLNSVTSSSLVTAYSKLGLVDEASKVFWRVPEPDLVLWNSLICGYGSCGYSSRGLQLFSNMRKMRRKPDCYTMVGLISGLEDPSLLKTGQAIHGFCLKCGLDCSSYIESALVSMYSRCNSMDSALIVFKNFLHPDLVTWSALIVGYFQFGDFEKAMLLFKEMNLEGMKADSVLIASVLAGISQHVNLGLGREVHAHVIRHGYESEVMVSSSLVDMYCKSGHLELGIQVFHTMPQHSIVSYNALILGLGLHGLADEAFKMFEKLQKCGLKPDESTFSALLCACCHAGLVKDGRELFGRMIDEFHIQARTEHFVYIVRLLGMAGELEDAYNFVLSLPKPVDSGVWGSLLSCLDTRRNSLLAKNVSNQFLENLPDKTAYIVILSNIFAGEGRWNDVQKLRDALTCRRVQKIPGLSWTCGSRYQF